MKPFDDWIVFALVFTIVCVVIRLKRDDERNWLSFKSACESIGGAQAIRI